MGRFGKDPCPFTGGKFATVGPGEGNDMVVRTPIFRENVTLDRTLFDTLRGRTAEQKLGLRRWIAEAMEVGELPRVVTAADLAAHHRHRAPSPGVKARRLLAWMVAERAVKGDYDLKYEFGASAVKPLHESFLITESDDRKGLAGPLSRLHQDGLVEYIGRSDQVVGIPSLTVRLTQSGIDSVELVPRGMVQQASIRRLPSARRNELHITRDSTPAEVERIIIRTVDRQVVRQRIIEHGPALVAMADQLLAHLDRALTPDPMHQHNQPPEPVDYPQARGEIEALRGALMAFRDSLVYAIAAPRHPVQSVIKKEGRLIGALKAVVDHTVGQRVALGLSGVGIVALAAVAGVPADPTITIGLMVAGPEGAAVAGKVIGKLGKEAS